MTMHLAHPALTMGGKRKGKVKFRNADEARKARELAAEWEQNQAKWANMSTKVVAPKRESLNYSLSTPAGRETKYIPSRNTGDGIGNTKQIPQYTGTKIIGIGTMHKSNAVPIFSDEEAQDISRMRRG
jgi:hypothetical protein